MSNVAFVNAVGLSPYARRKLPGGDSALERVLRYSRGLPEVKKVVLLSDQRQEDVRNVQQVVREQWDLAEVLAVMQRESRGCSHVIYYYADCPLLDPDVTSRMYADHRRYFADYTFADGYPYGMAPEILSAESIGAVQKLAEGVALSRQALFEAIQKDINTFDIETELSPADLRMLRVSLTADVKRNFILLERVMNAVSGELSRSAGRAGGGARTRSGEAIERPDRAPAAEAVLEALQKHPEMLRTVPVFFNVQIVEGCPQNCTYCPYPQMRGPQTGRIAEMAVRDYRRIVDAIEDFVEDGVVSVSLWGEPAFHGKIDEIAAGTVENGGLELLIETSGVGWPPGALEAVAERARKPPRWIVSLDAASGEVYESLRGDGFAEAQRTVEALKNLYPGRTYVQAVRMHENEEDLEGFFRHWKDSPVQPIIQKYDDFCGKLPDRKVTDLSPVKRFPCWHIKRDVTVLMDGRVLLCREDVEQKHLLGNILQDELPDIWGRGEDYYLRHIREDYPGMCAGCDEYYTFNY